MIVSSKKYNALSIDGGGALGKGVALWIMRYEQVTGRKFGDLFSAFAGTSTGAIIAAMLNEGYSGHDIYKLYDEHLDDIFKKRYFWNPLACPTYDNSALKKLLQEKLKGNMCDFKKPIFIPVTKSTGFVKEKVFDLGDKDMPKWKAVLASTSAPTFFYPVDKTYMDGGMWANAPQACLQAGLVGSEMDGKTRILSFATGGDMMDKVLKDNMGLVDWEKYITNSWVTGAGEGSSYMCWKNIGIENFERIFPDYGKEVKMDDLDSIDLVEGVWEKTFINTFQQTKAFITGTYDPDQSSYLKWKNS